MTRRAGLVRLCLLEGRILFRDPALWILCLLLAGLTTVAWRTTKVGLAEQGRPTGVLLHEERLRLAGIQERAARERDDLLAKGQPLSPVLFGSRHATTIGHYSGGRWMTLPALPTGSLAMGERDLQPLGYLASVDRWQGQKESQFSSPLWQRMVRFDVQFVAAYLLPLAIIVLCAGAVASERERGTLSLHRAHGSSGIRLGIGRGLVRTGILVMGVVVSAWGLMALDGVADAYGSMRLGGWVAGLVCYAAFWLGAMAVIDSYVPSVKGNLLTGLVAWVIVLFLLPALVTLLADVMHPVRSRADVERQRRQAYQDTWSLSNDEVLTAFYASHPEIPPSRDARGGLERYAIYQMRLLELMRERLLAVESGFEETAERRRRLLGVVRFASPVLLLQDITTWAAGTHGDRFAEFRRQREQFLEKWDRFYITRIYSREPIENLAETPVFTFQEPLVRDTVAGPAWSCLGLLGAALGLLGWASVRFRHQPL